MESPPNFRASIDVLAQRAGSVPAGWRRAYEDALVGFSAVDCPRRHDVVLDGPFVDDISLRVSVDRKDRVVRGIARSLSTRTEQTCEKCGMTGRLRTLPTRTVAVLCPTCAAPRILSAELIRLLRDADHADRTLSPRIWTYDEMPFQMRPVIPREAWRSGPLPERGPSEAFFVSDGALRRLKPRFGRLLEKLTAFIDASEPA